MRIESRGEPFENPGEIDPALCFAHQRIAQAHTEASRGAHLDPGPADTWETIKKHSVSGPATVTITGFSEEITRRARFRAAGLAIQTSKDPVGAPIFYRDVPLMPSETEKGVIKPLAANAVPLDPWRLRNVGAGPEPAGSRPACTPAPTATPSLAMARRWGMDMDGPETTRGCMPGPGQAADVHPHRGHGFLEFLRRTARRHEPIGFMSQVSPDGQYVSDHGQVRRTVQSQNNYYVVNFKDYRFLQVFYPTRGILAWYSRATGQMQPLPGADDPRYVQTDGVWSPDGKYLVFARAEARDPYPAGRRAGRLCQRSRTRSRSNTTSTGFPSMTARAASRNRSPALPQTA